MIRLSKFILASMLMLACAGFPSHADTRLLAITPNGDAFKQALEGLESDLGLKYKVQRFDATSPNAAESLRIVLRSFSPQGLVLMDSKAILLVKELQGKDTEITKIPKFVLMTLKAEDAIQGLDHVAGIKFEVPAYTIFTNLRILSKHDFQRIGVVYRKKFSAFIQESEKFLAKEKMDLVGVCLDCLAPGQSNAGTNPVKLKESIASLISQKVDVFWMLADNNFVNENTMREFWLTRFKQYGIPVVVPLPNLASLEMKLGMFGVWPDYHQLGLQAAQQVIQVFESGESPESLGLEPLISVQSVVNLEVARRENWALNKERLSRVSLVLK